MTTMKGMKMNRIYSLSDSYLTLGDQEENNALGSTVSQSNNSAGRKILNSKEFALLYYCNSAFISGNQKTGHLERATVRFRDEPAETTTTDDETSEISNLRDRKKSFNSNPNSLSNKLTTFSKWSRRVHKEESKLLGKFFQNFKRVPLAIDKENQLNINGDFKAVNSVINNSAKPCAEATGDNTFAGAKQRATVDRRRGVLRTMSETADFPRHFNLDTERSNFTLTKVKRNNNNSTTKQCKFLSDPNEDRGQVRAKMDKTTEQMNGDDETSSSYSTAEEDHLESDMERASRSAYATPRASVRGSRSSLRRSRSSVDALSGPEAESDNENSEAFMSLSDNVALGGVTEELVTSTTAQDTESLRMRRKSKVESMLKEDHPITVTELQAVLNCFKERDITTSECETLLDSLSVAQNRDDFQWSLHQLGGFNTLLFLYARVVEICSDDDDLQSKALCLTLTQLRNHYRITDGPSFRQYNLIRFVLNSERSVFGFKTFIHVMNFCLSASGTKIVDYQLLETCLLSSWKILARVRCKESDAPTGPKSLLECLLIIISDLLEENNTNRDLNAALLKANAFSETLLAICYNVVVEKQHDLTLDDGLRIASMVKSILSELMAPPDAYVAVTLVKYGLCPFLPRELPPLPRREDAFFMFRRDENFSSSLRHTLKKVKEAEEANEGDRMATAGEETEECKSEDNLKKDVPEIIGVQNEGKATPECTTSNLPQDDGFVEGFQESLLEGVMSILLQAMAILPDMAFDSILNPQMNAHLFVAYTSHSSVTIKTLALKLLSAYLTRAKNQTVEEFLKSKGFFLTSLYIQASPEMSQLVANVCQGFGPVSYPLAVGLLYSNVVVNKILEWIQEDEAGVIPALMSMGLFPSIFNVHENNTAPLAIPLQKLLSSAVKFSTLHPKEDPWKVLFVPAIESAYGWSSLVPRILIEATDTLRKFTGKNIKKSDVNNRLMWLVERSTAARLGNHFDKWLLGLFTLHIMEMDEEDETDLWICFVKKNRKKLIHLCGVFLCRLFAPNLENMDFKMYSVRVLLSFCPNLPTWLPKVLKSDEKIERCFTAFIRLFFNYADKKCTKLDTHLRSPSFQSLIATNGNLTLTLQMASALTNLKPTAPSNAAETIDDGDTVSEPGNIELSDSALRSRFENLLIDAGILSPTSNFSTFTPDFRNFKILLENSTNGVSPSELRQCLALVEKLRAPYSLSASKVMTQSTQGKPVSNAAHFEEVFEEVSKCAMNMLITVARARTQMEVEVARKICLQDEDTTAVKQWVNVVEQLVHPKAPWHFLDHYPSFCALDQSEGPGRVRMRLKREYLRVHSRFVMPKFRKTGPPRQPLEYLFMSHSADALKNPVILNEIEFMRFCTRIIPGEELPGEVILTHHHLTFIAENAHIQGENVEMRKTAIKYLMKRRYTLEDRAVEIFLECRSFLFVFKTTKDREEFVSLLGLKNIANSQVMSINSNLMEASITSMTSQWLKGHLSNFDYLMYLNTQAGRTYCDLMQYPVFPFVLAKYDSPTLDLLAPQSYRDLKKPMAIQDPSKEEHFVSTYNYLKRECETPPFHYGSHYSNSGIVLHFLVRLPPYTQHFLKYQDGSFDIPDRSFHSVETTWRLASKESNTDFKEAIPEFYYLPEFLMNLQHFDLGVRQNAQRVDDVVLPPWAKNDARLFTLINRQALESNYVRKFLCDWIDLIFGYKQTGKAAIDAINMFHPSTYEGFEVDSCDDELLIRARKAMVSTYGQTPKQLFAFPHPRATMMSEEKCEMEVLDTVWGIRWGNFVGSPACHDLEVIHTREYPDYMSLFETNSRVVFWPENTLILGDNVVGDWDSNKIRIKTKVVFNSIGDDITVCRGTTNSIWVGHHSGRISVLKLSPAMDKIVERVDLVGHHKPVKKIDVNLEFSMAISCAGENYAILWDINKYPKIAFNNVIECTESLDDVYSSRSTGDVLVLNKEYNRVTLFTINGFKIGSVEPDEVAESACLSTMDPGRNVNVIAIGCDYGIIRFYSTWDLKFLNQLKVLPLSTLPIQSLRYSKDGRRLYCMSRTEEGSVSVALQLSPDGKHY